MGGALYFLIVLIDYGTLAGFGSVMVMFPIFLIVMALFSCAQVLIMKRSDSRVARVNEVVQGIRIVKFFAWEDAYHSIIASVRKKEIFLYRWVAVLIAIFLTVFLCTPQVISIVAFLTYFLIHGRLSPVTIFTAFGYFQLIQMPLMTLPWVLTQSVEFFVSLLRIEKFLLAGEKGEGGGGEEDAEENEENPINSPVVDYDDGRTGDIVIRVRNGHFRWAKVKKTNDGTQKEQLDGDGKKKKKLSLCGLGGGSKKADDMSPEVEMAEGATVSENGEVIVQIETEESEKKVKQHWELQNINLNVRKGDLVMVIGPIGSGKSSLLQAILGEMPAKKARNSTPPTTVEVMDSVAYCSQTSWIQNATLFDNVCFGKVKNDAKFERVANVCCLVDDLRVLKGGRMIEIGEKGINLSGGQKCRVSLARACYSDASIVLLDDPLAAVDAHVGGRIMDDCICGYLRGKTRVLVTHHLNHLPAADWVILVNDGKILEQGAYSDLMAAKAATFDFVSSFVSSDSGNKRVGKPTHPAAVGKADEKVATDGITEDLMQSEERATGGVSCSVLRTYIKAAGGCIPLVFLALAFVAMQVAMTSNEWWLSEWSSGSFNERSGNEFQTTIVFDLSGTYAYYDPIDYNNSCPAFLTELGEGRNGSEMRYSSGTCSEYGIPIIWLEDGYDNGTMVESGLTQVESIYIYAALGVCSLLFAFIRSLSMSNWSLTAARNLHDAALKRLLRAPMSFFDTTPLGRIMNRFSNDVSVLDFKLVEELSGAIGMTFQIVGFLVMMSYATNGVFLPLVIPVVVVYVIVWAVYRKVAVELKRIESVGKSPMLAQLSETLAGVDTIRAYKRGDDFMNVNRFLVNVSNRAYYLLWTSVHYCELRLAIIGKLIIIAVCSICICLFYYAPDSWNIDLSYIALGVSYSIALSGFVSWAVMQMTQAEALMNSVERMDHYAYHLPMEAAKETLLDPKKGTWPSGGEIRFVDYSLRYRPGLPLVLKKLNVKIGVGEKIGIVGRTGSGKSSLLLALFRLVEAHSGFIEIDGVDTSQIGLDCLRRGLAIIPQDPVLFSGTVRSNLDPFSEYLDDALIGALGKSSMLEKVQSLPEGLDAAVTAGGKNFSVGERQLLCLGRALLRNTPILCFDACTSGVDMALDAVIQKTIQKEFADCTTLTIAHRLNTIIKSDRVLVLDDGNVVEFDTPANLLLAPPPTEMFLSLVMETGLGNAQLLFKEATGGCEIVFEDLYQCHHCGDSFETEKDCDRHMFAVHQEVSSQDGYVLESSEEKTMIMLPLEEASGWTKPG